MGLAPARAETWLTDAAPPRGITSNHAESRRIKLNQAESTKEPS